jgi:hypothetical protein
MTGSIKTGDRLFLAAELIGLGHPAWARVELVEFHADPTALPWNTGAEFPYRVGYVIEDPDLLKDGPHLGTVWLNASGRDNLGAVLEVRHSSENWFVLP